MPGAQETSQEKSLEVIPSLKAAILHKHPV